MQIRWLMPSLGLAQPHIPHIFCEKHKPRLCKVAKVNFFYKKFHSEFFSKFEVGLFSKKRAHFWNKQPFFRQIIKVHDDRHTVEPKVPQRFCELHEQSRRDEWLGTVGNQVDKNTNSLHLRASSSVLLLELHSSVYFLQDHIPLTGEDYGHIALLCRRHCARLPLALHCGKNFQSA